MPDLELPIHSDLTMGSLGWALRIGEENQLGKPSMLMCGTDAYAVAHKILSIPNPPEDLKTEDRLEYFESQFMPPHAWRVIFDLGTVLGTDGL